MAWASCKSLLETGLQFSQQAQGLRSRFAESAWNQDWNSARQSIAAHGDSLFRLFNGGYRQAIANVKAHLKEALPKTKTERIQYGWMRCCRHKDCARH